MRRKSKKRSSVKGAPIVVTESPGHRAVYASGVFGGLDPHDGRIVFFLDRIKPKMKSEPKGAMTLEKIERELQVEVHMSPPQFASVAKWMMGHVQHFEKTIKSGKKKEEQIETTGTSYIG